MRRAATSLAVALVLAGALGGCKKEPVGNGNASGEVLPGSISDAMLPEDRVTSQPPLDPGAVRGKPGAADGPEEASATPEPAATAAAAAEPAASKAAEQ